MRGARRLGGNGSERLAFKIGAVAISGDVTLVFGPEAVVALADRNLGSSAASIWRPTSPVNALRIELALLSTKT